MDDKEIIIKTFFSPYIMNDKIYVMLPYCLKKYEKTILESIAIGIKNQYDNDNKNTNIINFNKDRQCKSIFYDPKKYRRENNEGI